MVEKIQAIRGMNDIIPVDSTAWQSIESVFKECMHQYGYQEIRTPLVESTQLFKRSIGEITDIVEKEMYSFIDLNGESITLRPEGTAGCLRACIEHGLLYNQQQKLWYVGPMFRHEKPQKGRYRQFHQFGVEALGMAGAAIELELIAMCYRIWITLGLQQHVQLQINSLGTLAERQIYKAKLIEFFTEHFDSLDEDSQRRLHKNPLRILDSKNPAIQPILADAPQLLDYLGEESKAHFDALNQGLTALGIPFVINPRLVRGLDYYGQTVFEWVTDQLGSQATVCAGGRYDSLVEQLGGQAVPAIGFAMGIERLLLLLTQLNISLNKSKTYKVFLIPSNEQATVTALALAEKIRELNSSWTVVTNTSGGSFKSQFKKADKIGADYALIFGEEELKTQQVSIKNLRKDEEQITIAQAELKQYLLAHLR